MKKGEYLEPEIKVVEIACAQLIATSDPIPESSIEDSVENDIINW